MKKVNKDAVVAYMKEHGYPEVGTFTDQKMLQKFYKHLTIEELEGWVELEGLEVKPTDSEAIYRMRLCMAVLYHHFPKAPAKKKASKYAEYTLEHLVQLAVDGSVPVEMCDDERILRMRLIMALRAHKVIE